MANIKSELNNIKNALYGKDVRGSIHDGIDAINKEVENTTGRQVDLENTFDQLVINAGNSNAEIVDARVKNDGTSYSKLGDRLDAVDSQLAHNTNYFNNVFNFDNYGAVGDGVTDDTEAIKRCIAEASLISYSTIKSTPGKTYMISDTITINTNINIDLQGDMVYTGTNDRPAFVIGDKSKTLLNINVNLSIYSKKYSDFSDFVLNGDCDNMNIGVRLINIGQSKINIRKSNKFTVGVQCIAIGRGFYFNDLEIHTHSNMCELEVTSLTNGWINGNNFKKIVIGKGSDMKRATDLYGLLIHSRDGSYTFNSNWYNDITSEGYGNARDEGYQSILVYLDKCTTQVINFSRVENSAKEYLAYFTSSAYNNTICKSPSFMTTSTNVYYEDVNTELRNNVMDADSVIRLNAKHLIYDSGDLRQDVFIASNGKYASKQYYHTGYSSYNKKEIPSNNLGVLSEPRYVKYHSYDKPFLVLDATTVKTYLVEMNSGIKNSDEGDNYKYYYFFFDENDEILEVTNETISDYIEATNDSSYSINNWFLQSNSNMYGNSLIFITVTDKVKSIGIAFNCINNIKVYCKDATIGKVREDFLKKDRLYIGTNGYKIDDSTGTIQFTKI